MYVTALVIHVIGIISWMCGILYLFRLFIYHQENRSEEKIHNLLSTMERRLLNYITVPAMVVSWVAALTMISMNPYLFSLGWFQVKFVCVILVTASTFYGARLRRRFADQQAPVPTSKQLRWMNEGPTVLMIIIVTMVIAKPF